jgi:hypothetical protein
MNGPGRRALLGRIAEFAWFMQQGEPAATQALAMLLEDEPVRAAFVHHLESLTETDLGALSYFVPEAVHEDGARPDLEGRDDAGRPLIVMEAKFWATLESGQVRNYLADQISRLGATAPGVFVLLVPTSRVHEAEHVLDDATEKESFPMLTGRTVVVSWDDCISLFEEAVSGLPDGADIRGDLIQFRAMCATLGGLVIAPLGRVTFGDGWRDREEDLRQLVREATEYFVPPGARFPMASEAGYEHRRYIPGGTVDNGPNCSVGIGTRFADEGQTPFWLRYHRRTPDFAVVRARLRRSRYSSTMRTDDRHIWFPLDARPDAAGPELVQDLISQISDIISTASTG